MKQLQNYGDERQTGFCAFCGGKTETRDHVPSKVFLDKPYPPNLPVVFACRECNQSFSLDEEYLACLLESTVAGAVNAKAIRRPNIRRIITKKPKLAVKLKEALRIVNGWVHFEIESDRVERIVLKLAQGHAVYELNEPKFDEPTHLSFFPLPMLTDEDLDHFENPPRVSIWPEVGSRAMQRIAVNEGIQHWITVQPDRYRYLAVADTGISIRIVIGEYLGCEVVWP